MNSADRRQQRKSPPNRFEDRSTAPSRYRAGGPSDRSRPDRREGRVGDDSPPRAPSRGERAEGHGRSERSSSRANSHDSDTRGRSHRPRDTQSDGGNARPMRRDRSTSSSGRSDTPSAPSESSARAAAHEGGRRPGSEVRRSDTGGVRPGLERRSAGAKISVTAARALRSGHPWVFREALARQQSEVAFGTVMPIVDPEGYRIGWGLYDPEGAVALRILSNDPDFVWNAETMAARIDLAVARRSAWIEPELQNACRLIHGEADGFPGLAVDRLGDYLLVYKYARCAEAYLDTLIPLLEARLKPAGIYLQDRVRAVQASDRRPPAFHMAGKAAPPEVTIDEDGLRFVVDISAPISPGLFLDLREGRRVVERLVRGKTVLNLFSFTGAFGVRALRGGATSLTNVDAAARSHARCRQNLAASGMDPEGCEALTGDVFKFLERFRERGRSFDFVIVDPPPFSNVDGAVFSAMRDWSELMRAIADVVAPNGQVLAVCNAAGLSDQEFLNALGDGCTSARRQAVLLGEWGLPPDFPVIPAYSEGRYLKTKLLQLS